MPRKQPGIGQGTVVSLTGAVMLLLGSIAPGAHGAGPLANPETGSIEGQVEIVAKPTRRLPSAGAYPTRHVSVALEHQASELANVVVFVKASSTPAPAVRAAIRQKGEEFLPHVVAVPVGSTVEFPNDDLIFHNVFSLSRAATFDLGRYPRGQSKSRTFSVPGIVKVFCNLHSHMNAVIRVFDHPYFAIPDSQGRFRIDGLAPRQYDVVAWHERVGEVTLEAAVTAGRSANLSFSLPLQDVK
jgi:plastocyanin